MALFDRFGKLRDKLRDGRLHTNPKEILVFLQGTLSKNDLPAAVVEPAGEEELRATLQFASEKNFKIAVASGLKPTEVRDLGGKMLVLTTRLSSSPVFSSARHSVRVAAGLSVESLHIDLSRAGVRWLPLLPVPSGTSPGELLALGWEGLRTWRDGGFLAHVQAIEWMGYDGRLFSTGPAVADANSPDVSGFLFGSRGALGIVTALDLDVTPVPLSRMTVLLELPDAHAALDLLAQLRQMDPQPETVLYWGESSTQILREGTDNLVSPQAGVLLTVEWREQFEWPESWAGYGLPRTEENAINALWQDLFRFPRTVARLYPGRTGARLCLSAPSIVDFEEAARELGHDFNFPVALWGTVEGGQMRVWILQPDSQPRTTRRAEELLKKLVEVAVGLGGHVAPGNVLPFNLHAPASSRTLADNLRAELVKRCDPNDMHTPLVSG